MLTLAGVALFLATRTPAAVPSLAVAGGLVLVPAGLHLVYTRLRPDRVGAAVAGGLAALTWAGAAAGLTALAALRTRAPLIDVPLARADAALGIDVPGLVTWVALHPPSGAILGFVYASTVPVVFAIAVLLGSTGREPAMWRLCFAFAGSSMTCTLVSAFAPAAGAFSYYTVPSGVVALLPAGAGRYYLPVFHAYRSGVLVTTDLHHIDCVVSFPSFHAAMALMSAHALRGLRRVRGVAVAWSALVVVSTIPIGGHYGADVLAGSAVWAVFALLSRVLSGSGNMHVLSRLARRRRGPGSARRPGQSGADLDLPGHRRLFCRSLPIAGPRPCTPTAPTPAASSAVPTPARRCACPAGCTASATMAGCCSWTCATITG